MVSYEITDGAYAFAPSPPGGPAEALPEHRRADVRYFGHVKSWRSIKELLVGSKPLARFRSLKFEKGRSI